MNLQLHSKSGEGGFTLVEVLLATVILIIALVPLMDTITGSFQYSYAGEKNTILVSLARQKMENILAMDFPGIAISAPPGTPTALSDTVTVSGKTVNRDVLVEYYDGDGDSLPDIDLKKITVTVESVTQETLMDFF